MQGLDAPVLHPSQKEFNNPFQDWYTGGIERIVQSSGIVKVKSPRGWAPTKDLDVDKFVIHKPVNQFVAGSVRDGVFRASHLERRGMTVRAFAREAKRRDFQASKRETEVPPDKEKVFWQTVTNNTQLYGADVPGSLFKDDIKGWNLNKLDCMLTRVLDAEGKKIPGVNTAYLYFGTWRSTFPWHTEDKDLASINYLHFGAAKMWYCIPPKDRDKFEKLMRNKFPDRSICPEFLRHKAILAMPSWLEKNGVQVIKVLQEPGEFIISAPGAYHSGFNLGYNCAESTNFATESWLKFGAQAQSCSCFPDTVKIDMKMFLDIAPPKVRRLIQASFPSPSPSESDSVSGETSSSGSASDDACLAVDSKPFSSPKKRGRPPAAVPQPCKRSRKSLETVLPTKKRGRPPSCNGAALAKMAGPAKASAGPAGPAKASAALLGEESKRRRVGDLGAQPVRRPGGASAAAADPTAGPMRLARRTGVAVIRTTSQARSTGRPGSRQRALAMKAARVEAGIVWNPKSKLMLSKGKPGRLTKLKSCHHPNLKSSATPRLSEGPLQAKVTAKEGSPAQAGTQDLRCPGKRIGRRSVCHSVGLQGYVGQPTGRTPSTASAPRRTASSCAPSGAACETDPLLSKHGEERDDTSSPDVEGPVLHRSGTMAAPPQWMQGKDGPPFTPSKQAPASRLEIESAASEGPQPRVRGKGVIGHVRRTSQRSCKPTLKAVKP